MARTDQVLARYVAEIEERQRFIDGVLESAGDDDLTDEKLELVTEARNRIAKVNDLMQPLEEARRISGDSSERIAQLAKFMTSEERKPQEVEYRSAGEYVLDYWKATLGAEEANARIAQYNRAAAHQTTADSTGLLPTPILQPVVNFIDQARPLVSALGPRQLPSATWSRPKVTQHTSVAVQATEKSELVSQKMIITKLPVTPKTWGGYVNVSRQVIDWTQPAAMDIIINDLAAQYAIQTENATADDLTTAAATGPTLPTGTPTNDQVAAAVWTAAGQVYTATKGQGRLILACGPDMLGIIGPLFAPINPVDAQSQGFLASNYGQGVMGAISGIVVVVSAGVNANTALVLSTAAAEVYEDRIGSLQVVEPSVLGVQVAYAGYFADLVLESTGIVKIVKTP